MKRIAFLLCILFCMNTSIFADNSCSNPTQDPNVRYRLFPTKNMWTFLKLDTVTGKIWQVQYSVEGSEYRFETVLNSIDLTLHENLPKKESRYTLYPTENTYNFILQDQINGFTYQVQWSGDKEKRLVIPIR